MDLDRTGTFDKGWSAPVAVDANPFSRPVPRLRGLSQDRFSPKTAERTMSAESSTTVMRRASEIQAHVQTGAFNSDADSSNLPTEPNKMPSGDLDFNKHVSFGAGQVFKYDIKNYTEERKNEEDLPQIDEVKFDYPGHINNSQTSKLFSSSNDNS